MGALSVDNLHNSIALAAPLGNELKGCTAGAGHGHSVQIELAINRVPLRAQSPELPWIHVDTPPLQKHAVVLYLKAPGLRLSPCEGSVIDWRLRSHRLRALRYAARLCWKGSHVSHVFCEGQFFGNGGGLCRLWFNALRASLGLCKGLLKARNDLGEWPGNRRLSRDFRLAVATSLAARILRSCAHDQQIEQRTRTVNYALKLPPTT